MTNREKEDRRREEMLEMASIDEPPSQRVTGSLYPRSARPASACLFLWSVERADFRKISMKGLRSQETLTI